MVYQHINLINQCGGPLISVGDYSARETSEYGVKSKANAEEQEDATNWTAKVGNGLRFSSSCILPRARPRLFLLTSQSLLANGPWGTGMRKRLSASLRISLPVSTFGQTLGCCNTAVLTLAARLDMRNEPSQGQLYLPINIC